MPYFDFKLQLRTFVIELFYEKAGSSPTSCNNSSENPRLHSTPCLQHLQPNPSSSHVAVYTHKTITVKRRPDLEEAGLQLICLEAGLPGKRSLSTGWATGSGSSPIRKRSFKSFNPENFKTSVAAMPELEAIKECREVSRAATMLTASLTRILDRTD